MAKDGFKLIDAELHVMEQGLFTKIAGVAKPRFKLVPIPQTARALTPHSYVLAITGLLDHRCQQHHGNLSLGAVLILLV